MKILVGVDGSAHSETTLEFVRGMSRPAGAPLTRSDCCSRWRA